MQKGAVSAMRFFLGCIISLMLIDASFGSDYGARQESEKYIELVISDDLMKVARENALALTHETYEVDLQAHYLSKFTDKSVNLIKFIDGVNEQKESLIRGFNGPSLSNDKLWFYFMIDNRNDIQSDFVFEHRSPIAKVTAFQIVDGKIIYSQSLGAMLDSSSQQLAYRYPVFVTKMKQGSNLFVFEIDANAYIAPFFIWSKDAFLKHQLRDSIIIACLMSCLFIIVLYNTMQFVISRDLATSRYIAYTLGFFFYQSYIQGFGSYFLGQGFSYVLIKGPLFITWFMYFGMTGYAIEFLQLRHTKPYLLKYFIVLNFALGAAALLSFWNYAMAAKVHGVVFTVTIPVIIYNSFHAFRSGNKSAGYYFISWMFMGVGVGTYCLTLLNLLPSTNFTTRLSFLICAVAEVLFMSLAISDQSRRLLTEKNAELDLAIKKIEHTFDEMKKIVYPHQLEKIRNGGQLEHTMPTTSALACVISFDIIGSSKIQHINADEFFRNVFRGCNEIISEGYDGRSLKARAYRIKQMGDGFLCSVGFPFQSMSRNPANDSVDMAKRFSQVLSFEAKMLHSETPICCGIGIALDTITGFYPEVGTKEYDLYGPAIVLATRYEAMRKSLFESEKGRSVLIIQEKVFQSLDPSHREGFNAMDLKEIGIVVRDDPAAVKLYYQFLEETIVKEEPSVSHLKIV